MSYIILPFPQGSPEWKNLALLSSTDIPIIVNHNRYIKIDRVVEKFRLGKRVEIEMNRDMKRGIDNEPYCRYLMSSELSKRWNKKVEIKEVNMAQSTKYPKFGASADGLIYVDGVEQDYVVEIKCPRKHTEKIPEHYYDQMQWHCYILNKSTCIYMEYVVSDKTFSITEVKRNEEYIAWLEENALRFLNWLKTIGIE